MRISSILVISFSVFTIGLALAFISNNVTKQEVSLSLDTVIYMYTSSPCYRSETSHKTRNGYGQVQIYFHNVMRIMLSSRPAPCVCVLKNDLSMSKSMLNLVFVFGVPPASAARQGGLVLRVLRRRALQLVFGAVAVAAQRALQAPAVRSSLFRDLLPLRSLLRFVLLCLLHLFGVRISDPCRAGDV